MCGIRRFCAGWLTDHPTIEAISSHRILCFRNTVPPFYLLPSEQEPLSYNHFYFQPLYILSRNFYVSDMRNIYVRKNYVRFFFGLVLGF